MIIQNRSRSVLRAHIRLPDTISNSEALFSSVGKNALEEKVCYDYICRENPIPKLSNLFRHYKFRFFRVPHDQDLEEELSGARNETVGIPQTPNHSESIFVSTIIVTDDFDDRNRVSIITVSPKPGGAR